MMFISTHLWLVIDVPTDPLEYYVDANTIEIDFKTSDVLELVISCQHLYVRKAYRDLYAIIAKNDRSFISGTPGTG